MFTCTKTLPARAGGLTLGLALVLAPADGAAAQETHRHEDGTVHVHDGLHFTHPMIAESVTPDRKLRLDYRYFEFPDGDTESSSVLEGEWAFHRSFSIEAGIPYSYTASEFGNLEVLLKFANYAFEDAGLLLGYGLELGVPTNGDPDEEDEAAGAALLASTAPLPRPATRFSSGGGGAGVEGTLGTDEWELAPFLNLGWKRGRFELVGWGIFGIPFGGSEEEADEAGEGGAGEGGEGEEEGVEISYSLSALYAFSPRVQALLELDGSGGLTGESVGEDNLNLSPGIRFRVFPERPLVLGLSAGFPLTEEEFFDARIQASLFWHF